MPLHQWIIFVALIFTAVTIRVSFHTGYMGSDEVTYTLYAFNLLEGDWSVSNYAGANRFGINLPVAGFAYLFGKTEFSASIYSHLCSILEIGLIFIFGRLMFGLRGAVIATLILIFLPIHAHIAGRLMADAPLALMITASFLFFWYGETKNNPIMFFIAGLAAGLSFWIKSVTAIYLLVFILYPLLFFKWNWRWTWMVLGFFLAVLANILFIGFLTDDFLYLFKPIYQKITDKEALVAFYAIKETSLTYYLKYFFIKIYHSWLLAYLAVAGCFVWFFQRKKLAPVENHTLKFIILWFLGLVGVFSLYVVSLSPLILIPKQTNYMLMFVTPAALLAGYAVAKLRGRILAVALCVIIIPSTMLVIMHQSHLHVFTANSKAAVDFARHHPEAEIFSHTNPCRAPYYFNLFVNESQDAKIQCLDNLFEKNETSKTSQQKKSRLVIIDLETIGWQNANMPIRDISDVPSCWIQVERLQPSNFGFGWKILKFAQHLGQTLPDHLEKKFSQIINSLTEPRPAYVYKIPEDCIWQVGVSR